MISFSRVFHPAPPPAKAPPVKTVDDKIADLATQSADFIAGLALGNEEEALRCAAIARLEMGPTLGKLAGLEDQAVAPSAIQRAAQQRVADLIDAGSIDFVEFCNRTVNKPALLSIATLCSDASHAQQVIRVIDDPELLTKLAIEAPSSKVRQLAAETIQDPVQLRRILKDARSKDKNVYKIAKQKCDALHAEEKAAADLQATIETLCSALERHAHMPFDNLFAPTLDHLEKQWNAVAASAPVDTKTRAERAIEHGRDLVTQHIRLVASQAARAGAIATADADRLTLLNELRTHLSELYAAETDNNVAQLITESKERWSQLFAYKAPTGDSTAQFERTVNAITELTTLVAQHGSLQQQIERFRDSAPDTDLAVLAQAMRKTLAPASLLDAVPAAVADAESALQSWEQARHDKQAAEANALRQLGGLIRKASGVLADGKTGQAAGLRRAIEERLRALPSVPAHLTAQVQGLDEKLNLLQDWRSYVVAPKRIELIEQMESLIGAEDSPQVLADNIKRLQDEWKLISKGNIENTDAEWQRFHQAAQTAYQPCRDYFAAQAKQREANLEKRKKLLTRLSEFVAAQNWEQTDWREVARALRESKQLWRNHHIVERAANKPVQEAFDALTNDLQARLEAESAKNAEEKKSLIARAKRLLASEDSRQAGDEIKRLQLAWKNVGIVARDDDQKLWAEFREHCDAVFAKRQQAHTEFVAAVEEIRTKAIALCVEADQVAALSGSELLEGAKKLSALTELFAALGELPKQHARELQNRFDRALDRCEKNIAQHRAREKAKAWDNLLEAGGKIRELRLSVDTEQRAQLTQAAQLFIDGIQHWPKGGLQAIKNELAKEAPTDAATNEAALRTLCIRAEILTELPTPIADQTFRRNYQMQRLVQGMGQARGGTVKEELEAMVFEWIAVGPINDAVYAELLARFNRCRNQHQKHQ